MAATRVNDSYLDVRDAVEIRLLESPEQVNAYLAAGWKLIQTRTRDASANDALDQELIYSIAWFSKEEIAPHPESEFERLARRLFPEE